MFLQLKLGKLSSTNLIFSVLRLILPSRRKSGLDRCCTRIVWLISFSRVRDCAIVDAFVAITRTIVFDVLRAPRIAATSHLHRPEYRWLNKWISRVTARSSPQTTSSIVFSPSFLTSLLGFALQYIIYSPSPHWNYREQRNFATAPSSPPTSRARHLFPCSTSACREARLITPRRKRY